MSELDPVLQRAYSTARADRPRSGKGKAQTLAALGLSATSAHAAPRASAALASRFASWPWWALGVGLLAVSGAAFRTSDEPAAVPAVVSAGAVATAEVPAATLAVAQLPNAAEPAVVSGDVNVAAPQAVVGDANVVAPMKAAPPAIRRTARPDQMRSPALAAEAPSPPHGSESLRDEIETIERASRALSQRRCGLAREHLAAYEARFPNGRLRREAEVVAIEIAGRSGQSERARTAARRFVAQFPDTPYALRLAPWLRDDATDAAGQGGVVTCTDAAE